MRLFSSVFAGMMVGVVSVVAVAQAAPPQRGGGGAAPNTSEAPPQRPPGAGAPPRGQLAPDKAKVAWEIQARHLSQGLGLNDEQTKNVVVAYSNARETHAAAMRQLMDQMRENRGDGSTADEQGRREAMQKAFEDLNTNDREKLQAELAKSMTSEQLSKAMIPLGSFNANWDVMVDTVSRFNLDPEKSKQTMDAVQSYVTVVAKAAEDTDPEARRTASQQARTKLTETVKPILSQDQFGQFERTLGGMRASGRRPAAEGGRGGRGGTGTGGTRGGSGGAGAGGARGGSGGGQGPGGSLR